MVLLLSLINEELDRDTIVKRFGTSSEKRNVGIVALVPVLTVLKIGKRTAQFCQRQNGCVSESL
jgi:hypothetical protein